MLRNLLNGFCLDGKVPQGLAALLLVISVASVGRAEPDLSKPVESIGVADFRGRVWEMKDFDDSKMIVVAFLGTECPLAKLYAGRLQELQDEYADRGVALVGVMSNRQDSIAEISAFARRHKIEFPLLKDAGNRFADALGAERTPEVFVLDRERKIRYWGRIDDQYGIGYIKDQPESQDLRNAINSLLEDKSPAAPITRSIGCIIGRQKTVSTDATVTFTNEVARILNRRCVECHREGEIAPFALQDYEEAAGWADMIAEVVREERMPPWHADPAHGEFSNDRSLTEEEKQILYDWADAGAPQGNPDDLPEAPTFLTGWQLPREPDLVVPVSEKPYQVPANGEVAYQYFKVDPKFTEEKWLQAAELQPGNRSVVHHILCFVREKGSQDRLNAERGFLVGYVPGARVEEYPKGMAKRIPANSELIFQIHYTPTGTAQEDQSRLGLVFADPKEITHEMVTSSAVNPRFSIPPHDPNYEVNAVIPEDLPNSTLLAFSPHMHLRGKAFRYELISTDGTREILLDVPEYDFNWQTTYVLAEPRSVEEGSRIACAAAFDNSEKNLNNPDPSKTVGWGDQTYDEMMIGYFHYSVELGEDGKPKQKLVSPEVLGYLKIFAALDADGDDKVDLSKVPSRFKQAASKLDSNDDGILTRDEVKAAR